MFKIDLNSDLGESFGNYKIGKDSKILDYITSANIACGWHAGDPLVMDKTVKLAKQKNVKIGAHPGFLDKMSFGRRKIDINYDELKNYVKYQLGSLLAFTETYNIKIQHLKPHGAMYNMAAKDYELAKAIAEAIYEVDNDIILLGLSNSQLIKAGNELGLKVANEVFADRAYNSDGTLVSRTKKGAVIHDLETVIERIINMITKGKVKTIKGKWIDIKADSICVHGDTNETLDFVKNIKKELIKKKVNIVSLNQLNL